MRFSAGRATQFGRALQPLLLLLCASRARAQELEPRSYANAPTGLNFLVAGYAYAQGDVSVDPVVPLTDANIRTHAGFLAYARTFDVWGKSAKGDVVLSYAALSGDALFEGAPVTRTVSGLMDPRLRFAINLMGAPALEAKEYPNYQQDLIIGASVQVAAPLGQYDETKLVNIGNHRWSLKTEIGVSKAWGPWTLELAPSVTVYTHNNDFLNGGELARAPLYALQGHVVYTFLPGLWASLDAVYFAGGRPTVNGAPRTTVQDNVRLGSTIALPVNRYHSIKLSGSLGAYTRFGTRLDIIGVAWQYRWGGGY